MTRVARGAWVGAGIIAGALGCSEPAVQRSPGDPESPLRVGTEAIDPRSVSEVAVRQRVSLRAAAEAVVRDALFARAFEREAPRMARYLESVGLGRRMSERLLAEAEAAGPPTDAELAEFTRRHFATLDRPRTSRVTHAVVLVEKGTDRAAARALSEDIRTAVAGSENAEQFRERASAVAAGTLKVKVEDLAPVTLDGRVIDPENPPQPGTAPRTYAAEFARAADALPEVGAESPVVETPFGFHVMLLTERIPELRVPLEQRRRLLAREILDARAKVRTEALLSAARTSTKVEVDAAALALTEGLRIAP